jgi:DNA-directed RNA polymerase specialized sigma24 family protein
MVVAFFSRVERAGWSFVKDLAQNEQERVHAEVKDVILKRMWGTEGMDALELSFKKVVDRLYMTAYDKISLRLRTEISWEDLSDGETGETGQDFAEALGLSHRGHSVPLAEVKTELAQIMDLLSPKERDAVNYVHALGMTEFEAAEQMGCTDRNVRHLLKKAREKAQATNQKGAQDCAGVKS